MFLRKNDIDRTRILHRQLDGRTQTDTVIPVYPPPPLPASFARDI